MLAAVNSAGNNMARAAMTGALVGALVGASAIPCHFIDGLAGGTELLAMAQALAAAALPDEASAAAAQGEVAVVV